jgi:hypothetical protein
LRYEVGECVNAAIDDDNNADDDDHNADDYDDHNADDNDDDNDHHHHKVTGIYTDSLRALLMKIDVFVCKHMCPLMY